MTCEVISHDDGRQVTIPVDSRSQLPALSLTACVAGRRVSFAVSVCRRDRTRPTGHRPGDATAVRQPLRHSRRNVRHLLRQDRLRSLRSDGYALKARADATANKQSILLLWLELQPAEKGGSCEEACSFARSAGPAGVVERGAANW